MKLPPTSPGCHHPMGPSTSRARYKKSRARYTLPCTWTRTRLTPRLTQHSNGDALHWRRVVLIPMLHGFAAGDLYHYLCVVLSTRDGSVRNSYYDTIVRYTRYTPPLGVHWREARADIVYRRFSARRFGHPPPQSGSPLAYAHSSTPVGASMRKRMRHLARAHARMRQSRRLRRRRMAALRLRVRSGRHGSPELGDSPRVYAHASHAGRCQHTEARARGLAQERLANHRRPLHE